MMNLFKIISLIVFLLCFNQAVTGQIPELEQYVAEAAENNPGLKSSFLQYQAALEKVPQVGSLPDPEVSFGYFISPVETRVGPQQARISAMQMFPWFGTLSSREEVATAMAKAKFEAFNATRNQLSFEVKKVWFQLYELEHSIKISELNLDILRSYEQLATTRSETGKGSLVDILRIQLEISELENQIQLLKDRRNPLRIDFNRILNREPLEEIIVRDSLPSAGLLMSQSETMDSIKTGNPILISLRYKQEAMLHSKEVAKKEGLPSFGAGLNYISVNKRDQVEVERNGRDAVLPMITVRVPIYQKKYKAKQREADFLRQSFQQSGEDFEYRLLANLEAVWVEWEDAKRREILYEDQELKANQAQDILVRSYSTGGKDFEEILRIQRMILKYQLETVRSIRDQYISLAHLEMLYGKY